MRIYLFILLLLIPSFSFAGNIISAEYSPDYRSLITVMQEDNKTFLLSTSLTSCTDSGEYVIDGKVTVASISKYVPYYLMAGANGLFRLYTLSGGKTSWNWDKKFSGSITKIAQDKTGEYIAVTDGSTVAFFRFGKKWPEFMFSKESAGNISAVLPDPDGKKFLVAERSGIITVWSFSGNLVKSINIGSAINSLITDGKKGGFLLGAKDGLYFLKGDTLESKKILNGSIDEVMLDEYSSRLAVNSGGSVSVYDYPSGRLLFIIKKSFGKLIANNGAKFLGLALRSYIKLYDIKLGMEVAIINVTEKGSLFMPAETALTGVDASLINLIVGGKQTDKAYDVSKVCAPVAAMVSGIYAPTSNFNSSLKAPNIKGGVGTTAPVNPKITGTMTIPEIPNITISGTEQVTDVAGITSPNTPKSTFNVQGPKAPLIEGIKGPELAGEMAQGSVPSWVAMRKNLQANEAVATGSDIDSAFKNGKKQIKDNLVKGFIRKLLSKSEVKEIKDTEAVKRFLWMVSSSAANDLGATMTLAGSWVSPGGQNFAYTVLKPQTTDKALEKAYNEELKLYNSMSVSEYMARKPNVID